jgi:hypothetical protein
MVADALARPLRWVRRRSMRLLTGLAALALVSALGAATLVAPAWAAAPAPAPAQAAVGAPAAPATADRPGARSEWTGPARPPVEAWVDSGDAADTPRTTSDEGPAGGVPPLAVGERAPPAPRG